ncbi:Reverse transcriptase zinc-binding domain [Sesbania bispinosa]|nr:Reverse transcriptase zinc-binding domain [Sesbania bispinosa]
MTSNLIVFDEEDIQDGLQDCKNNVIGKLLTEKSVHVNSLSNAFNSMWNAPKGFKVFDLGEKLFQIFFETEKEADRVVRDNHWVFRNSWLVLRRWERGLHPTEMVFHQVPVWLQIWGLPIHCRTKQMGQRIGSCMGNVLEAHCGVIGHDEDGFHEDKNDGDDDHPRGPWMRDVQSELVLDSPPEPNIPSIIPLPKDQVGETEYPREKNLVPHADQDATLLLKPRPKPDAVQNVHDLINPVSHLWNTPLIENLFLPIEADQILCIPLPTTTTNQEDKFYWGAKKDGVFTVRSGYHFALQELKSKDTDNNSSHSPPDFNWKKLWSFYCQPRILHFIWRLMHNSLPVRANLLRRNQRFTCLENAPGLSVFGLDPPWGPSFYRLLALPLENGSMES